MSEIQAEGLSIPAQDTIQDPPEYNTEKQGSDWLGGPQNGSETPDEAYFIPKHRNETPGEANYQAQSHSVEQQQASGRVGTGNIASTDWLGGPQNGDEIPGNGGNGAEGQAFIGGPQDV